LGGLLFSGDNVHKKIEQLSGGEATRVLIARVMLMQPNVIILDEPTNHLDMESIDALARALKDYPGTVLTVSHDRDFISQVATRVVALTPKGLQDLVGSYDEFLVHYQRDYLERGGKHDWITASQSQSDKK
jgi:ATPase subunit of ABC transporter with duplicated ATPase domains